MFDEDKTEDPTEKKKLELRESGEVFRVKGLEEFTTVLGLLLGILILGSDILKILVDIMSNAFMLDAHKFEQNFYLVNDTFQASCKNLIFSVIQLLVGIVIMPILLHIGFNGFYLNLDSIAFNLDRVNPLLGLQKIISKKSFIDLCKSLLKFFIIFGILILFIIIYGKEILLLDKLDFEISISLAKKILFFMLFYSVLGLLIVAGVDFYFQFAEFLQKFKMSKYEIKEESKATEGKPEIKSKIRKLQQQLRKRKMMNKVKDANVIITNPDHFAIAIKYDEKSMSAPQLVAKGKNIIAEMIKKVASTIDIPIISAPPLARSIYFFVDLDEQIPAGLYLAVAKILAYVYELKAGTVEANPKQFMYTNLEIPTEYQK